MGEDGKLVPVEILHADEPVMEVRLANGYSIRCRLIVTGVFEAPGQFDNIGNPILQMTSQVVVGIAPTRKAN